MVKKVLTGLFCLILVSISFNAFAQSRTAWERNDGEDHASWAGETTWEGIFSHAVIPAEGDAGWVALGDFDPVVYSSSLGLCQDTNAPNCQDEGDFTYFRSFIDVPAESTEFTLDEFTVNAEIIDSGLRVSIFNSLYPDGEHIMHGSLESGSHGSISTNNLKSYVVPGEINTIIITLAGNCCNIAEIVNAHVLVNGKILTICDPIVVNTQDIEIALGTDGNASISAAQVDAGSTGGCDPLDMTVSPDSFTCDNLGPNTVTLTVTDIYGNSETGTAVVTIVDTTPPAVSNAGNCPANGAIIEVNNDPDACGANVSWTPPTFADNCPGVTVTSDINPGHFFPAECEGSAQGTIVTYTAVDACGNSTTRSFTVKVLDKEAPVLVPSTCPADILVNNDPDACGANVSWTPPTFTDNCPGITVTSDINPGHFFPAECEDSAQGTVVTYTAVDACGNFTICQFKVTVLDKEAPVLVPSTCPADILVNNDPGVCGAEVTWTPPTFTDNCPGVTVTSDINPGHFFPAECEGSAQGTIVTYTAVDACGNSTICEFTVTVLDKEAPVISITEVTGNYYGLRLEGEYGYWDANDAVFWNTDDIVVHYEVSDNCDPNAVITYAVTWEDELKEDVGMLDTEAKTLTIISPYDLVGTLGVTITATDICGNAASDATEFEVILRVPDGQMIVKPESFCVNPGKFNTFLWFPELYDVTTISEARCDGAPLVQLNIANDLEDMEVKGILKFRRDEIVVLPVDTFFVTRGIFTYNGKPVYFQGSDTVKWDCRRFQRREQKRQIREQRRRLREQAKEAMMNRFGFGRQDGWR